jgi:RNA recognition motif-containing protein
MNMYVSNLGFQVTDEELRSMFSKYGEVTSVKVIADRETGKSRGFAFVEMADQEAEKAMKELDGTSADGRTISVSKAKPKSDGGSFQRDRGNRW